MKRALTVVGIVLVILGAVWYFQGTDVLPGSFMTGQRRWAVNGGIAVAAGLVLIVLGVVMKKKGKVPPPAA
jgi:uncharacterized membrane protein